MKHFIKLLLNKRFRRVFFLFISFGMQFWWMNKRKRWLSNSATEAAYKKLYDAQALAFTTTAIELQGLLIKLGQFFSSRVDILPKEYTDQLSTLQDAVVAVDTSSIIARIEQELKQPIDTVFPHFAAEALAAASLGQVHRATLRSGEQVAVKILRPGIEETVEIDLQTIKMIIMTLQRVTSLAQSIDLDAVYEEFLETINDELDYIKEGKSAETFAAHFSDDDRIYVPAIYWNYSSGKVLTMEFIEGIKITDYANSVLDKSTAKQLAETIFSSYLKQVLVDGFFHADPHPGNLLVREDGTLVFIDFGMMGYVSKEMKDDMVSLVLSLFKDDAAGVIAAFDRLGFLRPHADHSTLTKSVRLLMNKFINGKTNIDDLNLNDLTVEIRELMYSQPFQVPAKTTFLGKALFTLFGICYGMDEDFDIIGVSTPYLGVLIPGMENEASKATIVLDQLKQIFTDLIGLPEKLNRTINHLETGELRIHPSKSFETRLFEHQSNNTQQIIKAILIAGIGIIGAIFYMSPEQTVGIALLAVSALGGISLLRPKRQRKQRSNSSGRNHATYAGQGFKKPRMHP